MKVIAYILLGILLTIGLAYGGFVLWANRILKDFVIGDLDFDEDEMI